MPTGVHPAACAPTSIGLAFDDVDSPFCCGLRISAVELHDIADSFCHDNLDHCFPPAGRGGTPPRILGVRTTTDKRGVTGSPRVFAKCSSCRSTNANIAVAVHCH